MTSKPDSAWPISAAAPLLVAWRSAVILNDVAGREVFDVGDSDGPVVWQELNQQRWSEAI